MDKIIKNIGKLMAKEIKNLGTTQERNSQLNVAEVAVLLKLTEEKLDGKKNSSRDKQPKTN
jgi:hypothetical protein